METGLS